MRSLLWKFLTAFLALFLLGAVAPAGAAPATGSISGTVTDSFGPVATAQVLARDADSGSTIETTTTDAAGTYTLGQLPAGRYLLTFLAHGYAVPAPGYLAARVTAGSDTAGVDVTLTGGASITGHVTDALGADLAGAQVIALNADAIKALVDYTLLQGAGAGLLIGLMNSVVPATMTAMLTASPGFALSDASGNYTIDGLRPGNYLVGASAIGRVGPAQTPVTISAATDAPSVNIAFAAGSTVSGHVLTADGKPVEGATVTLDDNNSSPYAIFSGSTDATTDATGAYAITGVQPGSYTAFADGQNLADMDSSDVSITSASQSVTTDFALPGLGTVSGNVLDSNGNPVPHAAVLLLGNVNFAGSAQVATDQNGHYTAIGLPDDTYDISVSASGYISPADGTATLSSATPTASADFSVAKGATIRGVVRDPMGHPVYGATVIGIPTDMTVGTFAYTSSLPDGSYELSGLDVATYHVDAEATGFAAPATASIAVTSRSTDVDADIALLDVSKASTPGKPRIATQATRGVISVVVGSPTNDGGNPVTRYNVVVQPGNHKCTSYSGATCRVTGLLDGVLYATDVSATNEVGTGSMAVLQTWTPPVPAVTSMKSRPGKKGQAIVSFKAPKTPNTITTYKLEYKVGSKWKVFVHPTSRSTTLTVKGLPSKKSYTARITTVLKLGRALTSKTFTIKTG